MRLGKLRGLHRLLPAALAAPAAGALAATALAAAAVTAQPSTILRFVVRDQCGGASGLV